MKQNYARIILSTALILGSLSAFAGSDYYSKRTAKVANSGLGTVYISVSGDKDSESGQNTETATVQTKKNASSAPTYTYTFTATAKDGYYCTGWYAANSGGTPLSTTATYKETGVSAKEKVNDASKTYYARFAAIPVSAAGTASTISFNHPETKTVTLSFAATGADAKDDFYDPTITSNKVWTIKDWSWNTSTKKVDVVCQFVATSDVAKGTYEATVEVKSKGNQSNTGKVVASVDLTPTLTYNNGSVDISVSDADKTTLDLNTLRTAYQGADNVAGDGAITYALKTANSNVSLTSAGVFYAKAEGTYTIVASAAKKRYYAKTAEFTVTVGKRAPTVEWKEFDHIYSGNTLNDVTAIKYNGNIVSGLGITLESKNPDVMTVEGNNLHAQILATQQDATIQATTEETTYYKSVTPTHTYTVEAKQTPEFMMNGKVLVAADTTIHLKIGETATMAFDKVDESQSQFTYPTTSGPASYTHNSTNHTGTITANYYGNRDMVFEQIGTTTIFGQKHTVTVYVDKHPVTLSTTDALNNMTWLVDDVFEGNIYTVNTPASGEPAQKAVTVTSNNEEVLKLVDGKWKAIGEGDATLTIAQESNDYWTGASITKTIHVSKRTPVITWNTALNSNQPWAKVIDNPVSSTNTDIPFIVTSSDKTKADYVNGKIEVYNGTGDVTFTLTQEGNYKWNAATTNVTKTFTVYQPENHVPFTISSNNKSNFQVSISQSDASWTNNGCDMGYTPGVLDAYKLATEYDKNAIYHFTGVPDKLTFERTLDKYANQLPGTYLCQVYESPNNEDSTWEIAWQYNTRDEKSGTQTVSLKPSTRYIKFRYNGTLTAHYKNIKVSERKEIIAPTTFDFTSGGIGDNPTTREISIKWYNVRTCSVAITGTDAKYFKLGDGSETIYSQLDTYNEDEKITVKYLHDEIKKHTATLTITSADGKSATITLKGETTKAAQEITWNPDLIVDGELLIAKDAQYDDVATASSGLPVELYVADGEKKLTVINGEAIKGLADGTTKLYAIQAGNANKWAEVTDSINVQITSKTVQKIDWDDPLSNIQYTGTAKNITLHASSHEDSSLPITYTLDADAQQFASVNGNTLTITGTGTGKITARQVGNSTYVAVSATMTLTSYNPNQNCSQSNISLASTSYTLFMSEVKELEWNEEPEELSFTATVGSGALIVTQWYDNEWHPVAYLSKASSKNYGPYPLDRKTRKIKFEAGIAVSINVTHSISNIKVTKARYLEVAENYMDFSSVQKGQTVKRQFTVNYSDASGVFEVSLEKASEQFQLLSYTLGSGCEDTQKNAVIKVNCTGKTIGKETNKIIIKNKTNRLEIPLEAVVTGLTQQINWNFDETEEINTTDNIQLSATAGSGMPVTFSSGNESVAKVKKVGENYYLNIIKDGEVTITAVQEGDDDWVRVEKQCTFNISKVTPTISTLPTAEEVILPKQLMDCSLNGGEAKDGETVLHGTFTWDAPSTAIERNNTGYAVTFTPENDNWYTTANCTVQVPVLKTPQAITWTIPGETDGYKEIYCNASLTFDATAGSNLPVQYVSTDDEIAYVNESGKLIINRGGEVTITAKQEGDATYAAATPVEKTINILRVSPAIVEYPVADTMSIGTLLSNATIRGGVVKLGEETVLGSFSWVNGDNIAMNEAGTFQKEILFTPTEAGWYEPITGELLDVTVEKYAPVITTMGLTAADITYGETLSGSTGLSGTLVATDTVKKPNIKVSGTYAWVEKENLYDVNTTTATAVFIPDNGSWYDNVEFEVPLTVNPGPANYSATANIFFGQTLEDVEFTNTTKGLFGEDVPGTVEWAESVDQTQLLAAGEHTIAIRFTPEEGSNYAIGIGSCTLTVEEGLIFMGDAEADVTKWSNEDNWTGDLKPGVDDRVVINANVEVDENVSISSLTINEGFTVTVKDGASLTVGEYGSLSRTSYGNIIVEAGGQLLLNEGQVALNDFTLHAAAGDDSHAAKSGQVSNEQQISVQGKAYFVLDIDPSGATTTGWYDFTVPFPVDALHGITRWNAETGEWMTLVNETDYAVMTYHEELRARGEYGWQKYKGIMQPGVGYSMTANTTINRYRFEMVEDGTFNSSFTKNLQASEDGLVKDKGWNIIGNGTMTYVTLDDAPRNTVQIFNHTNNAYDCISTTDHQFVVGSAYFVQADAASVLNMTSATGEDESRALRAPKRTTEQKIEATITISQPNSTDEADRLMITADEDATSEYIIGKDLLKMGTMSKSLKPRIWTAMKPAGILCAVNAPMQQNETVVPFKFYMPTEGTYTISAQDSHAENVYLLRNEVIVWNLSMSDYTLEQAQGLHTEYSIMLVKQTTDAATGVDNLDNDAENGTIFVEKMIVNGQLFILRDGILYDAQGRKVER